MKKLFELRQQKTALKNEMRSLLTTADGEKRSLTDEEGKKFEELRVQADALDIEIGRLETVQEEERNLPGTQVDGKGVTNDELRTYILTCERRALSTAVGVDGGYTVIPELDKEVMRQMQDDSVMRQIATVKTTKTNEYKKLVSVCGAAVIRDDMKALRLDVKNFSRWITKLETEGILKVDGEVMTLITRRQSEE